MLVKGRGEKWEAREKQWIEKREKNYFINKDKTKDKNAIKIKEGREERKGRKEGRKEGETFILLMMLSKKKKKKKNHHRHRQLFGILFAGRKTWSENVLIENSPSTQEKNEKNENSLFDTIAFSL